MKTGFDTAEQIAKEEVEKQQQQAEVYKFDRFSVPTEEGIARVRFIVEDGDDSLLTVMEHATTMNNTWFSGFECPNESPTDGKCVVCQGKAGTDFESDRRQVKHYINLIDRTDNDNHKVKVWSLSSIAMAPIMQYYREYGNVRDRDYTVQLVENKDKAIKGKFIYKIEPVTDEPSPLTKADKTLIENRFDLSKCVRQYDEKNLLRIMAYKPGEDGKKTKSEISGKDFLDAIKGGSNGGGKTAGEVFKNLLGSQPKKEKVEKSETPETTNVVEDDEEDFETLLKQMNKS